MLRVLRWSVRSPDARCSWHLAVFDYDGSELIHAFQIMPGFLRAITRYENYSISFPSIPTPTTGGNHLKLKMFPRQLYDKLYHIPQPFKLTLISERNQ